MPLGKISIAYVHCRVCGRRLTSPRSMAAGVGSTCAAKGKKGRNRKSDLVTIDMFEEYKYDSIKPV